MSQMEHNKGKLIPFDLTEAVAKDLVIAKEGTEDNLDYPTYLEQVSDDPSWYDEGLCNINGDWYKVEFEIERGEIYGFAHAKKAEDGVIEFDTYHYNGGGHWTEVVENALERNSK